MNKFYEAACAYAEAGRPVLPLKAGDKSPITLHGVKDATTNLDQIRKWWTQFPDANVGIAVGHEVFGLDIDYKDGADKDFLKRIPVTAIVKSPSGGHHAYFKLPEGGIKNGLVVEKGVTVRSSGYYFAAPPSFYTKTASTYEWDSKPIYSGEIAECPEWILEINNQVSEEKKAYKLPDEIPMGSRDPELFKFACSLRAKGMEYEEILTALEIANKRCAEPKPQEKLEEKAKRACGYEKKEEKEKAKREKNKISQEEIERLGKEILDCRFKIYRDNEATILYNITDISKKEIDICTNEEFLWSRLRQNVLEKTGKVPDIGLVHGIYGVWRLSTKPLSEQPKSFTWKNEDEWSFKKLNFIPEEGEYPAWWEFLERLSSYEDFMAFVWSIFEPKNTSRQFLWLSDLNGEGGKSSVISVLAEIFGGSFEALNNSNTTHGVRWLMGQLYGKRLAAWADCKNPQFCMSEIVRNITSGDWVTVEMKGQPLYSAKMYMKLIIGSNYEPAITGGGADTSRLIHIKVSPGPKKDDPEWPKKLKAELPYFLWACKKVYETKCPHHGKIALQQSTIENVESASGSTEDRFEEILDRRIILGEGLTATIKQFHDLCKEEGFRDNFEVGNFKVFLKRHGVTIRRSSSDKRPRLYYGMNITSGI